MKYTTREQWLGAAAQMIMQRDVMATDRRYRVSCGLPSTRAFSAKNKAIGQCWHEACTEDSVNEVYVSPTIDDAVQVFGTLTHELCHVVAGLEAKHGLDFKKVAQGVGLAGKMTATYVGDEMLPWVEECIAELGPYPHRALSKTALELDPTKSKQSTRMLKAQCDGEGCEYTFRISKTQAERGLPACPVCGGEIALQEAGK